MNCKWNPEQRYWIRIRVRWHANTEGKNVVGVFIPFDKKILLIPGALCICTFIQTHSFGIITISLRAQFKVASNESLQRGYREDVMEKRRRKKNRIWFGNEFYFRTSLISQRSLHKHKHHDDVWTYGRIVGGILPSHTDSYPHFMLHRIVSFRIMYRLIIKKIFIPQKDKISCIKDCWLKQEFVYSKMKRAKFIFNIPDVKLYPVHPTLLGSTPNPIRNYVWCFFRTTQRGCSRWKQDIYSILVFLNPANFLCCPSPISTSLKIELSEH